MDENYDFVVKSTIRADVQVHDLLERLGLVDTSDAVVVVAHEVLVEVAYDGVGLVAVAARQVLVASAHQGGSLLRPATASKTLSYCSLR